MDDVLSHIVLTPRDKDFLPCDQIRPVAIRIWDGFGTNLRQIRTGLRLGQIHGASPNAFAHFRQINCFKFIRSVMVNRFNRTQSQQWSQRERQVRSAPHFFRRHRDQCGQALTAKFGRCTQSYPARFLKLLIGFFKAFSSGHSVVFPLIAFVACPVDRGQNIFCKFCRFFCDRIDELNVAIFVARQAAYSRQIGQLIQDKTNLFLGDLIAHALFLMTLLYSIRWRKKSGLVENQKIHLLFKKAFFSLKSRPLDPYNGCGLLRQLCHQFRHDGKQIAHDAVIGNLENRSFFVFVDRNDDF